MLNACEAPFSFSFCTNEYGQNFSDAYTYDLAGNRTDPSASAVVGPGNRTTQFYGATYTYNASGQVSTRWDGALSWTYGWSPLDELKSATATGQSVTYGYDALGRRVRRTANGTTEYYVHDGDQIALDLDGSQGLLREYGWRPGVDQLLSVKLADGTTGVAINDPQLGATVEGLVNVVNGTLLADFKNTAWGKKNDAASFALRYRMAGREYDEVTKLYYMRARYYDPTLGKFLSEDPIGIEGGLNLCAYAGNDPVNNRDPSGTDYVCWTWREYDGWEIIGNEVVTYWTQWVVCNSVPGGPTGGAGSKDGGGHGSAGADAATTQEGAPDDCYENNRFSSNFGTGVTREAVEFAETGSMISLGSDIVATALKATRGGVGGSANPYASGINMLARGLVKTAGRALNASPAEIGKAVGKVTSVGDKATPPLAILGAFTFAYNTTIDIQCRLGIIK